MTGSNGNRANPLRRLSPLVSWEGFLLAVLCIVFAVNAGMSDAFFTVGNQINLFNLSIEKIIVALIMTFIIINGEIDLSVASVMGLSACTFGWVFHAGIPAGFAIAAAMAVGVACGVVNGFFITRLGIPSLVVTLSTLIGYRGLARVLVEDRGINHFPEWFDALGQQPLIGPFPLSLIIFVVLFVVLVVVLHFSGFGRRVYVIGNNAEVATYSGVDVVKVKMQLFVTSSTISALAGLLFAARVGAIRGDVAQGFELDIITIVLLGGVSIFGGSGSLLGTLLSILIVLSLRNGMDLANITGHIQTGLIGLLLILSVLIPNAKTYASRFTAGAFMEASEAMVEKTKIEEFKVPIVRQSVSDQVAERILELVRNRTLRAGDQLPTERDLAASLHVSRPSVREAIRGLTLMGIVRSVQGGGAYIGDLNAESLLEPLQFFISLEDVNIQELYDARTMIESNVASRAAQFMTDERILELENIYKLQKATLDDPVRFRISDGLFHELIWEGCGNAFLSRIGKSLHVIGQEFRQRASETPGVLGQSYIDHRLLLKAIKARKPDVAAQAAAKHMQNVLQSTLAKSNWAA